MKNFTNFIVTIMVFILPILLLSGCGEKATDVEPEVQQVEEKYPDIRPEFKEMLDNYEVFVNDYCDFLEQFEATDDAGKLEMMNEYSEITTKYYDTAASMQEISQEDLTADEMSYYAEVMGRCSARMIQVNEGGSTND